jgi:hypothetical protein
MQEGKNGSRADQQEKPKLSEFQRCHQLMERIVDVAVEEFPDISPARFIFVLEWIKHRYLVEIEGMARGASARQPEPQATPIVCKI